MDSVSEKSKEIEKLELNNKIVINDYQSATKKNIESFLNGNVKATSEYIYDNQKFDAISIINTFYEKSIRVISIVKRTKVGMDGLMIEIAKNITTHPDNNFLIHRDNIFFITAMNNLSWEDDMKDKIPSCFKENVFHHGKLQKLKKKLYKIKNALIINDEIDTGDKENQKLHKLLHESSILDIKYMEENNIYFVFVSATMINELRELYKWGDKHHIHYMTIPDSYIGHKKFLDLGIIQEFYPITNTTQAERWIKEDIIDNYGDDYRVHIIRTDEKYKDYISNACLKFNIDFRNHTSEQRIIEDDLIHIFNNIQNHLVIAVKGFYRRANLIPNEWKLKIGATHERYSKNYDTNVQVQGLPGRMSGYWKDIILNGHKTGPHRTSIQAIKEYEEFYENPLADIKYSSNKTKISFVHPRNIKHLEMKNDLNLNNKLNEPIIRKFVSQDEIKKYYNSELKPLLIKYENKNENCTGPKEKKMNNEGFFEETIRKTKKVYSISEIQAERKCGLSQGAGYVYRACYRDINDTSTVQFLIIHKNYQKFN